MTLPSTSLKVFRSLTELSANFGPSVAAIGNFDGLHCGHRQILSSVVAEARASNAQAVAITFEPHPEKFLFPNRAPKLITPSNERLRLLAATGIDAVLLLPFDEHLAQLSARDFVEEILVAGLQLTSLHEGENFRFGRRAEAGVSELKAFGLEFGFQLHIHEAVHVRRIEVSSSAIRARVAAGDLKRARWLLGRPFSVLSAQKRDRGVGTELLVPTINLAGYTDLLPANGVYVTRMNVGQRSFQAVTNVGNRPTFAGAGFSVETHILNFEPIEIGAETPLELEFLFRLRGEKSWPSPEALKTQIFRDVARAKRYFQHLGKA
jgi:riboflavin kinase/FMN adenylyltransferase